MPGWVNVIVCVAWVTLKLCDALAASVQFAFPAASAFTVHSPTFASASEFPPLTVQVAGVPELKTIGSPEFTVAWSVTGDALMAVFPTVVKLIVCVPWLMVIVAGVEAAW